MDFGEHSVRLAVALPFLLISLLILAVGPGRLLGRATMEFCYSRSPLNLRMRDGKTISLPELCRSILPPCNLNPFIFNGDVQTMWTVMKSQDVPIYYKRHVFENDDPTYTGSFAVDFVVSPYHESDPSLPPRTAQLTDTEFQSLDSDDSKPMLVLLHGLSGGSYELYLRHVVAPLAGDGGWEACVVNARGCAMSKITTSVLFNARATWDVRYVVKWLRKTFPNRPLFGMGFSLGANILANVCTRICLRLCSVNLTMSFSM